MKKLNVTPEDNDTSKALLKQAEEKQADLVKALNGAAFDKAYAENEVAYHKAVDGALQSTLIPSASNAELKDLLVDRPQDFPGSRATRRTSRSLVKVAGINVAETLHYQ